MRKRRRKKKKIREDGRENMVKVKKRTRKKKI
jgi:hypothetical protein